MIFSSSVRSSFARLPADVAQKTQGMVCFRLIFSPLAVGSFVDELFADTQVLEQSVTPPEVSDAHLQQQQNTATFCPQRFPDSWTSFLAHGSQAQQEILSSAAGGRSSDHAQASLSSLEAKQERTREKNRRAMRKFREKQKVSCQ